MIVSTTLSLKLTFGSSFRQSLKNFSKIPALWGILVYSCPRDWMVSILNSTPKSGRYALIYFSNFWTWSSLQVLSRVEMASEATDRLGSVIRMSNSLWHKETSRGYFALTLLITLRAANLYTGFPEFCASCTSTWNATSTSITLPKTSKSSQILFAASNCTVSSSFGRQVSIYCINVFEVRWSSAVLLRRDYLMNLMS